MDVDIDKVKSRLREAFIHLYNNDLCADKQNLKQVTVEGLLGITLNNEHIVLVNVNENLSSDVTETRLNVGRPFNKGATKRPFPHKNVRTKPFKRHKAATDDNPPAANTTSQSTNSAEEPVSASHDNTPLNEDNPAHRESADKDGDGSEVDGVAPSGAGLSDHVTGAEVPTASIKSEPVTEGHGEDAAMDMDIGENGANTAVNESSADTHETVGHLVINAQQPVPYSLSPHVLLDRSSVHSKVAQRNGTGDRRGEKHGSSASEESELGTSERHHLQPDGGILNKRKSPRQKTLLAQDMEQITSLVQERQQKTHSAQETQHQDVDNKHLVLETLSAVSAQDKFSSAYDNMELAASEMIAAENSDHRRSVSGMKIVMVNPVEEVDVHEENNGDDVNQPEEHDDDVDVEDNGDENNEEHDNDDDVDVDNDAEDDDHDDEEPDDDVDVDDDNDEFPIEMSESANKMTAERDNKVLNNNKVLRNRKKSAVTKQGQLKEKRQQKITEFSSGRAKKGVEEAKRRSRQKSGVLHKIDEHTKMEIAMFSKDHGAREAARVFSKQLGRNISEYIVLRIVEQYAAADDEAVENEERSDEKDGEMVIGEISFDNGASSANLGELFKDKRNVPGKVKPIKSEGQKATPAKNKEKSVMKKKTKVKKEKAKGSVFTFKHNQEVKRRIIQYAIKHGHNKAAEHFSTRLGVFVSRGSVGQLVRVHKRKLQWARFDHG